MISIDDTIAAIATPIGSGAIGIVKLSGPDSLNITQSIFTPFGGSDASSLEPRYLYYGQIIDPQTKVKFDEALVAYMPAPHSYTRQDVVEIQSHGGILVTQKILQLVLSLGARPATAGEMTMRAFINGRLDLSQAEAVLDIINAKTEASLRVANQQLGGTLSGQVSKIRQDLLNTLAFLEASIDFVEDDIPEEAIIPPLKIALTALTELIETASYGLIYRQGIRTAIIGRPNVGKSSLLNALLRGERAIVTNIPGTTRDTLEETANIGGIPLILVDTAGIRNTPSDAVEEIGINRSRAALSQADLALLVIDNSEALTEGDWEIAQMIQDKTTILILNKQDLPQSQPVPDDFLPETPRVSMSALTGTGLDQLEAMILTHVTGGHVLPPDEPMVSNPRHQSLLYQAANHIKTAISAQQAQFSPDLVSIDLREAVDALGKITGENVTEDLLNTIFSRFCIGK